MKTYGEIITETQQNIPGGLAFVTNTNERCAQAVINEFKRRLWRPVSEPPEDKDEIVLLRGGYEHPMATAPFRYRAADRTHWLRLSDLEPEMTDEEHHQMMNGPRVRQAMGLEKSHPQDEKPKALAQVEGETAVHAAGSPAGEPAYDKDRDNPFQPTTEGGATIPEGTPRETPFIQPASEGPTPKEAYPPLNILVQKEREISALRQRVEELEKMNTELDRFIASHTLPWRRPDEVPTKEECDDTGCVLVLYRTREGRIQLSAWGGDNAHKALAWLPARPFPEWVDEKEDGFMNWMEKKGWLTLASDNQIALREAYEEGRVAGRKEAQS